MAGDVIRNILINDYIDTTAAAISTLNGGFPANKVPPHCYLSLKTLLLGAGATAQDLADAISPQYGMSVSIEDRGIDIAVDSQKSIHDPGGLQINNMGSESAIVRIIARLHFPIQASDSKTIDSIHKRIIMLLDAETRIRTKQRINGKIRGDLPTDIDPTIDDREPFLCEWLRYAGIGENSVEMMSLYRCSFRSIFLVTS